MKTRDTCTRRPVAGRLSLGRALARIFAVLALGAGAGMLTWGITSAALGEPIRSPQCLGSFLGAASEAIGCGAGLLAAGVTALVLSFIGRGRDRGSAD